MQHKERIENRQESQGYVNSTYGDPNNKNNWAYLSNRARQ